MAGQRAAASAAAAALSSTQDRRYITTSSTITARGIPSESRASIPRIAARPPSASRLVLAGGLARATLASWPRAGRWGEVVEALELRRR
eukprot:236226-Alexandrium_andersonii.AAC.2